jgi:hypothetical protein
LGAAKGARASSVRVENTIVFAADIGAPARTTVHSPGMPLPVRTRSDPGKDCLMQRNLMPDDRRRNSNVAVQMAEIAAIWKRRKAASTALPERQPSPNDAAQFYWTRGQAKRHNDRR